MRSAWVHDGAARVLVHRLKYEGLVLAAAVLARHMVSAVPSEAAALVPVPRSRWRAVRYGVDPGRELAIRLSMLTGLPVVGALAPPVVAVRNAGRTRPDRHAPGFGRRKVAPEGSVLVDDVVTTGATLAAAIAVLEGRLLGAVTATVSV